MADPARPRLPLRWTGTPQPALVGRGRELAVLDEAWSHVLRGCRQVVIVGGEPGAGKSRLLAELCTTLDAQGACVLVGSCAADLGLPYQPFVEPVEALLVDPAFDDAVAEGLRAVTGRAPGGDRPQAAEHRRQLYDGVVEALRDLSSRLPVVLALEDLHWAGPPALELLTYLAERMSESRVLVLATHRTTAPDTSPLLVGTVSRLYRLDGVRRLHLDGLRTEHIADYLVQEGGLAPHRARGPAAVLRDLTGGNPFFLREVWRDLMSRGGVPALDRAPAQAPLTIRDALHSRLLGLSEPQRQTLELAAVVGEEVDAATVLDASDWGRDTTLRALDHGVAYGLLQCVAPGRYRFPHALARQAVIDLLPPSRRAHQHARVAEVLEARPGNSASRVRALAHHYTQAQALGHGEQAVRYLVEAARSAEQALAHEDAARGYEQAASLSQDAAQGEALRLSAARSHLLGGDFSRARGLAEQVAASPDPVTRLQGAVLYEAAAWRPGLPGHRAIELLSSGLASGPQDPDDPLRLRALASLGRAFAFTGDTEAARSIGAAAISRARRLGDDRLLAHALQASLWHGLRPQDVPDKLVRARELSALAHRTGDLGHLGPAAYYRGVIAYVHGDRDAWAGAQADLLRMTQVTGQGFFEYMAGCLEYGRQFLAADFAGAQRTCDALLDLGERFGTDGTEGPSAVQTFMLRRETGALERVRPLVTGAESPAGLWAPGLLALYTELELDEPAARLLARLLADDLAPYRDSAQWPAVLVFAVEAALHLADPSAVERLRPDLEEHAGRNLVAGQFVALFGSADRYLGAVDSLLGRPDAEGWFASALALDRRTGAPVHEAQTLAATVVHRRRAGAADAQVEPLVRRTRALAEPLGLVRTLRLVGRSSARIPTQHPDRLTDRETEVLRLLGEGLLNREIGERLFISEHTAANHVRSILAKTGSANRTQAALYAAGHHLLS